MHKYIIVLLGFSTSGIGFIAENLLTTDCDGLRWKMCSFLQRRIGDVLAIKYVGKMLPDKMTMSTSQRATMRSGEVIDWYLNSGTLFQSRDTESKIESKNGRDRLSIKGFIYLLSSFEEFPGTY